MVNTQSWLLLPFADPLPQVYQQATVAVPGQMHGPLGPRHMPLEESAVDCIRRWDSTLVVEGEGVHTC